MPVAIDLAGALAIQARANRLANHRLHGAMAALPLAGLQAPRVGFFPSLMATLNHILGVDQYYVGSLLGEPGLAAAWAAFVPAADLAALRQRQALSDERLTTFCDALDAAGCAREVQMARGGGRIQRDLVAHVLAHLFMHQTHHRGQLHAMLSGTAVAPPQLDEFLMPSEAHLRQAEMAALGWDEAVVYGGRR
ncbi:MAG: DinB family protein [Rubrivivax sp.]|nr:DinB family protein [Rubrivivax sp.]